LCRDGVGDEYHYLFLRKNEAVFELRQKYIPRYYHLNRNINKMGGMLSLCNLKLLSNIAVFVNWISYSNFNVRIMFFCPFTYSFCYLHLYICWCMTSCSTCLCLSVPIKSWKSWNHLKESAYIVDHYFFLLKVLVVNAVGKGWIKETNTSVVKIKFLKLHYSTTRNRIWNAARQKLIIKRRTNA
jgi:hypothetical protein